MFEASSAFVLQSHNVVDSTNLMAGWLVTDVLLKFEAEQVGFDEVNIQAFRIMFTRRELVSDRVTTPLLASITILHEGHGAGKLSFDGINVHGVGHLQGVGGAGSDHQKFGFLEGRHGFMDHRGHDEVKVVEILKLRLHHYSQT